MGTWQDDYAETRPDPGDDLLFRDVSDNGTNADGKVKRALILGLVQQGLYVNSSLDTPPGSPSVGDRHRIIATATGAWASQEDKLTEWDGTAWQFLTASEGWQIYDQGANARLEFDGSSWAAAGAGTVSGLTDTTITSPADGQALVYDSVSSAWINDTIPGSGSTDYFRAELAANANNVTGNSTLHAIVFDTVDVSASWASLNTGTGVVTLDAGTYWVGINVTMNDLASANTIRARVLQEAVETDQFWGGIGVTAGVYGSTIIEVTGTGDDEISADIRIAGLAGDTADLIAGNATSLQIRKI